MQAFANKKLASMDKAEMLWLRRTMRSAQFALQMIKVPGVQLEASLPELPQDGPTTSKSDAVCFCHQTVPAHSVVMGWPCCQCMPGWLVGCCIHTHARRCWCPFASGKMTTAKKLSYCALLMF